MSIGLLFFLIAAVVALSYYAMIHAPREELKRFDKKLGDINQIHRIIDDLRSKTVIQRVLIWKSENGGGIARFGDNLKMSVVYESYEAPFQSVKDQYEGIETDGNSIKMLVEMQERGEIAMFIHDMNDKILKRLYQGDGAFWSMWFSIGPGSDKAFYYASISTNSEKSPYQINQGKHVDIAKNALRRKYQEMNATAFKRLRKTLRL